MTKYCKDCAHFDAPMGGLCQRWVDDLVYGHMPLGAFARHERLPWPSAARHCGLEAQYWVARPPQLEPELIHPPQPEPLTWFERIFGQG